MNKNTVLAITACLLWSTAFVGVKVALGYISPLVLGGMRFMLAGLLLLPLCGGMANLSGIVRNHTGTVLKVSLLQTFLLYGSFFIAMQYVRGAPASIIIGSSPLVSALVAHVMMKDDKMTRQNSMAIILGIIGIVIIVLSSKPWDPVGVIEFRGILLLIFGTLMSSISNVVVAKKRDAINPIELNSLQMFLGGCLLLITGLVLEGPPDMGQPLFFYGVLLWLAVISAAAFSIWFYLLARIRVSKLNVWKFLIPVFGALICWILLPDESPDIMSVLGVLLVSAGIIYSGVASDKCGVLV